MGYGIATCQMQHDAADEKRTNKIQASYTIEGTALENVDNIKYLGVTKLLTLSNEMEYVYMYQQ